MNFYLNYIFSRNFNLIFYSFSKYIIVCGLFIIFLVTFAYKSHIKYMKGDVVVSETPSDSAPTPTILVCVKQVNLLSTLEWVWWGSKTFFTGHDNQLPSLSGGIHGLKDFLCSGYILGSSYGRSCTIMEVF